MSKKRFPKVLNLPVKQVLNCKLTTFEYQPFLQPETDFGGPLIPPKSTNCGFSLNKLSTRADLVSISNR